MSSASNTSSPQSSFKFLFITALTSMWFSSLVNSLWSPRLSHAQPIRLFPHTSLPKNLQTNLTPFPAEILPRSAVHVPIRKDRDIEKTRTRTLSSVKGTASSADPNEEDIINPDVSFFLNLGPLDGESASPTDSDRGHRRREQEYGSLSYLPHVVPGLDQVDRIVHTATEELGTRGLTPLFPFFGLDVNVNSSGVRRLVQAFLRTCVLLLCAGR